MYFYRDPAHLERHDQAVAALGPGLVRTRQEEVLPSPDVVDLDAARLSSIEERIRRSTDQ
jgi:hypothetical protein